VKILLDSCVWGGVKTALLAEGYEVFWVGELTADPGDEAIIQLAYREQYILVTLDKDFGELAIFRKMPHHGILRLVNHSARRQAEVCLEVLKQFSQELTDGAIITAERFRIRIRTRDN
jgi:predicted nuclease of predicted toxin-antitoxin system